MAHVDDGVDVDGELVLEFGRRAVHEVAGQTDAGAVHHRVHADAQPVEFGEQARAARWLREVERHDGHHPSVRGPE
ncbi:hypothetical protein DEJ15_05270 [Curtobacterium sp. MCJR17_043]|nr:hypothetical protein [Curtobacterium sp. MCJR17_043]WIB36537.1 hypothetical protein DEJ15_05270 [Curtobacterium sp. MCJR17_043]